MESFSKSTHRANRSLAVLTDLKAPMEPKHIGVHSSGRDTPNMSVSSAISKSCEWFKQFKKKMHFEQDVLMEDQKKPMVAWVEQCMIGKFCDRFKNKVAQPQANKRGKQYDDDNETNGYDLTAEEEEEVDVRLWDELEHELKN